MFEIFKKQPENIVELIHNDFNTATDRLLEEARQVLGKGISKTDLPTNKAIEKLGVRLEKAGFVNSEVVRAKKELIKKQVATILYNKTLEEQYRQIEDIAFLIESYQVNYPFQKFITENELNRICQKYKLIYAPVENYIGNVPEKNLIEIEKAPPLHGFLLPLADISILVTSFTESCSIELKKFLKGSIKPQDDALEFAIKWIRSNGELNDSALQGIVKKMGYKGGLPYYILGKMEVHQDNKDKLMIAAPKSEFDLEGVDMKSKFGYARYNTYKVKDPIVFRYCKGGLQVISKWGLEAEAVTSPIEN